MKDTQNITNVQLISFKTRNTQQSWNKPESKRLAMCCGVKENLEQKKLHFSYHISLICFCGTGRINSQKVKKSNENRKTNSNWSACT